jgi:hypothetical protein
MLFIRILPDLCVCVLIFVCRGKKEKKMFQKNDARRAQFYVDLEKKETKKLDQDTKKKGESNLMLGNESSSCGGGK